MSLKREYFQAVNRAYDHYSAKLPTQQFEHIPLSPAVFEKDHPGFVGLENVLSVNIPEIVGPLNDILLLDQNLDVDGIGAFQVGLTLGRQDTGLFVPNSMIHLREPLLKASEHFQNSANGFNNAWCSLVATQAQIPGGMKSEIDSGIFREGTFLPHMDLDYKKLIENKAANNSRYVVATGAGTEFHEQSFDLSECTNPAAIKERLSELITPETSKIYDAGTMIHFKMPQVHNGTFPKDDLWRTMLEITWTTTPFNDWAEMNPALKHAVEYKPS